ncbi:MAG: hypothetical protein HOF95_02125, partial [Rhodospirillales bacterium]|nr:hypothetical protein [Rhodospirillales bacterium]
MSSPQGTPQTRPQKWRLSALTITSLSLVLLVTGVVTWLALTDVSEKKQAPKKAPPSPALYLESITSPVTAPKKSAKAKPPIHPKTKPTGKDVAKTSPVAKKPAEVPPVVKTPPTIPVPKPAAKAPPAPVVLAPAPKPAKIRTRSSRASRRGLRPAPDPSLVEKSRAGPLPRISTDGRKPWKIYARPFDHGTRLPRIGIIIENLGLSGAGTEAAIQRLPGTITLSFAPYAKGLKQWIALARTAGHEVMLGLPMEPLDFPASDPGPHTLLTSLTTTQNIARLHWLLGRVTGYVGVVNQMGSRFTISEPHLRPILGELKKRGLLFVDSRSSLRSVAADVAIRLNLPRAVNNRFIDAEASRGAIDKRLRELERIAKVSGFAVGIGSPFPVTLDR